MDRYRVDKVVGKGSFGQAVLCSRIADGKVRSLPAWNIEPRKRAGNSVDCCISLVARALYL